MDAGLDLVSVDRALSLLQRAARLEDSDLHVRAEPDQFVCGEDAARACSDDDRIIMFHNNIHSILQQKICGTSHFPPAAAAGTQKKPC